MLTFRYKKFLSPSCALFFDRYLFACFVVSSIYKVAFPTAKSRLTASSLSSLHIVIGIMAMKIPGPQGLPLIGNLLNILADDSESQLGSLEHFADVYGPIYQFTVVGQRRIVCSSSELLAELIDEKRFVKIPPAITTGTEAKGLFTARHDDPDWGQAHRILMPAFGPLAVEGMFDGKLNPETLWRSNAARLRDLKQGIQEVVLVFVIQIGNAIGSPANLYRHERYCEPIDPQMGTSGLRIANPCDR